MINLLTVTSGRTLVEALHHGPGDGAPTGPFWESWPLEPLPLLGLGFAGTLYVLGWRRLARTDAGEAVPGWRVTCFMLGLLSVAIALLSPVAAYSERLFFMHMVQHLLLLLIAPPLLLLGAPLVPMLWGLPADLRRGIARSLAPGRGLARVGRVIGNPLFASVVYVATVAMWHVPALFDAAQGRTLTHYLQHLMFFITALLYWWPVIYPAGGRRRLSYALAIPYLLPPFLEGMLIGALLTFADRPLYSTYQSMDSTWGFSVLDDQQLGGLIMWVPGGLLFLIPLIGLIAMILRQEEADATKARRAAVASTRNTP